MQPVLNNRLIRRLQRHQSMAVIFRSVESPPFPPSIPPPLQPVAETPSSPSLPVVQARLLTQPVSDLPMALTAKPAVQPVRTPPPAVALPVPAAPITSASIPVPLSPLPVPPMPTQPSAAEPAGGEMDERTWRRLQTILRKHEEQKQAQEAASSAEEKAMEIPPAPKIETPEQTRSAPVVPPAPRIIEFPQPRAAPSSEKPAVVQPEPMETKASVPAVAVPVAEESTAVSDIIPPVPEQVSAGEESSAKAPVSSQPEPVLKAMEAESIQPQAAPSQVPGGSEQGTQMPLAQNPDEQQATVTGTQKAEQPSPVSPLEEPVSEEVYDQHMVTEPKQAVVPPMDDETLVERKPLPLQAVWPVERVEPSPSPVMPVEPSIAQAAPPFTVSNPELERIISGIKPGQPTDSRVEVIMPRQPRPVRAPVPETSSPPASVQAESESSQSVLQPAPELKLREETVATEIGNLPADLWKLVGEKPPEPVVEPPPQPAPRGKRVHPSFIPPAHVLMEEPGREVSPAEVIQPAPAPAVVQTSPAEAATTGEVGGQADAAPAQGEVNIDELARKVYSEIKRRLMVEWERIRQRF